MRIVLEGEVGLMAEYSHQELRRVFELVVATSASQRSAVLERECGGDVELRKRLDAMIAALEDGRFLATPTQGGDEDNEHNEHVDADATLMGDAGLIPTRQDGLREGPGTRIGPYKILQLIGEGGFGSVFMAEQERPVNRKVALKIIKLGMDTRQVVARFEQERQALAMMDHPNIARVLDAGATETGRPYFVMDLVKGDPIAEYCDRNNLSIEERLELFAQVCLAVQHAHTKGIIHRDIKPSNILVSTLDGKPTAKVIDFGIAKATASKLTEKTLFTEHRQLIGTPEYMSPEQAEGSLDIDTRTDVYSLGVLLYELLTGSTPFDSKSLRSAAYAEIQRIIREVEPPKPSTRLSQQTETIASVAANRRSEPGKLGTTIRGELDWIVMKALEKDRSRRYETANGLAADIQRYLAGEAVVAAPPSSGYRLRKLVQRHKGVVIAGSAVATTLVLGIVGTTLGLIDANRQREQAIVARADEAQQRELVEQRAKELTAVSAFQAKMLSQIDVSDAGMDLMNAIRTKFNAELEKRGVSEGDRMERAATLQRELGLVNSTDTASEMIDRTMLTPARSAIESEFKQQPAVDASLRVTLAEVYSGLGQNEQSLALATRALELRTKELGPDHRDTLMAVNDLAYYSEILGRLEEAESLYKQAYEGRKRVLGEDDNDTLTSMGNLGNYYRSAGKYAEAEPLLREGLERCRRVLGDSNRTTLIAMNTLGFLFVTQGKYSETEPLWREAAEKGRKALGETDRDVLTWTANVGGLMSAMGKVKDAEPFFRESLDRHRRLHGEEHPRTIQAISILAGNLAKQARFDEAEPLYRQSVEKSVRVLGPEHPQTLTNLNDMGYYLFERGRLAEAEPYLRDSLETRRRVLGADHLETSIAMAQLAKLYVEQGRMSEAEVLHRNALNSIRTTFGSDHPSTLVQLTSLGSLYLRENKLDLAEPLLREAAETRRRVSGPDHRETLVASSNVARLLELQGQIEEAEKMNRELLAAFRRVMGDAHPDTLNAVSNLASVLARREKWTESMTLYREALSGFQAKFGKDNFRTASARIGLGDVLTKMGQFKDAEGELIEAERVMTTVQGTTPQRRKSSFEALISLYEAWEKAEPGAGFAAKALEWKNTAKSVSDQK